MNLRHVGLFRSRMGAWVVLAAPMALGLTQLSCGDEEPAPTTPTKVVQPRLSLSLLPVNTQPRANGVEAYTVVLSAITTDTLPAKGATFTLTTDNGAFSYRGLYTTKLIDRFDDSEQSNALFRVQLKSCTPGPVTVKAFITVESRVISQTVTGNFLTEPNNIGASAECSD
jgi:hypothetical protein